MKFDPTKEMVVLFNTLAFDRFENINCLNLTNNKEFSGYCLTPQHGQTCFDDVFLSKSHSSDEIAHSTLKYRDHDCHKIINRFYECIVSCQSG